MYAAQSCLQSVRQLALPGGVLDDGNHKIVIEPVSRNALYIDPPAGCLHLAFDTATQIKLLPDTCTNIQEIRRSMVFR